MARIRGLVRDGAPLDIEGAWAFHCQTRERDAPRTGPDIIRQKEELQRALKAYREKVREDFGIDLLALPTPDIFAEANGRVAPRPKDSQPDRRWYYALERMRATELARSYQEAMSGVGLPKQPSADNKLVITDVGSRSGFFSTLMAHERSETESWQAIDIQDPGGLPVSVHPRGGFRQIAPFTEIPKSDVITLNCVLHHVGEITPGQYDERLLDQFIASVYRALPKDGLIVVTEDFVGKDRRDPAYLNFIKGVDDLFYPQSLGNQKPARDWARQFEEHGFKLEKQLYPVSFNVVGFPTVETVLVFRKK